MLFSNLKYKLFALNDRDCNLPNLWGLWNIDMDPMLINTSYQHISFTLKECEEEMIGVT